MYNTVAEAMEDWNQESALTQKVLDALTDASLGQPVSPEGRTLGRIAWHIVTSVPGMLAEFGLSAAMVQGADTVPASAKAIADGFRQVSAEAAEAVKQQWTDAALQQARTVFGRPMTGAAFLALMLKHIIHHRGQMTVLMRQAGLKVPGVYGPAKEEWSRIGQEPPVV